MPLHSEMRRLQNKWRAGTAWPKRMEWIEIQGIRGWTGQRIDMQFPIVAIVGENGSGKSTVLQAAAAMYNQPGKIKQRFASDFFPDTPFEKITSANLRFSYREGVQSQTTTVRKRSDRWRGNPERPERRVTYVDLSRIQPVGARVGYVKLLKASVTEGEHTPFNEAKLGRLSHIMDKNFQSAGVSVTSIDDRRFVPVVEEDQARVSGFHQGTGIIAVTELIAADYPQYGLVLIDEVETSLHPRAQRRLMHDLARIAREKEIQFILSTHSPYILSELPPEGRIYLMDGIAGKTVVTGVSPDFAMTRMDEEQHPECDVYVEDPRAATMVAETLLIKDRDLLARVKIIPYGSASVGTALGIMASQSRFPRSSVVYLDGDQAPAPGCTLLPGDDAPERVIYEGLQKVEWKGVSERIGRSFSETVDALNRSMNRSDHHEWIKDAADRLIVGGDILWQALCATWALSCATPEVINGIAQPVQDALDAKS